MNVFILSLIDIDCSWNTGTGETVMRTEKWNLPKRVRKTEQYMSEENSNYMLKVGFEK